jgi:hypothetical protein
MMAPDRPTAARDLVLIEQIFVERVLRESGERVYGVVALRPGCHRAHHKDQLGISGNADDPDGLTFTDTHGNPIDVAARPIKPTGPPPAPAKPYEHPIGERLYKRELLFADPPVP